MYVCMYVCMCISLTSICDLANFNWRPVHSPLNSERSSAPFPSVSTRRKAAVYDSLSTRLKCDIGINFICR